MTTGRINQVYYVLLCCVVKHISHLTLSLASGSCCSPCARPTSPPHQPTLPPPHVQTRMSARRRTVLLGAGRSGAMDLELHFATPNSIHTPVPDHPSQPAIPQTRRRARPAANRPQAFRVAPRSAQSSSSRAPAAASHPGSLPRSMRIQSPRPAAAARARMSPCTSCTAPHQRPLVPCAFAGTPAGRPMTCPACTHPAHRHRRRPHCLLHTSFRVGPLRCAMSCCHAMRHASLPSTAAHFPPIG